MNQQVEFQASPSATAPGQWVGIIADASSKRVLTCTTMTYTSSDEARFGASIKWLGRNAQMALAAGLVGERA